MRAKSVRTELVQNSTMSSMEISKLSRLKSSFVGYLLRLEVLSY